jgi:hypothetical protein
MIHRQTALEWLEPAKLLREKMNRAAEGSRPDCGGTAGATVEVDAA